MAVAAVTRARQALAAATASASTYGPTATFTTLPSVGQVISRGQALLRIDGVPAFLLYGPALPSRAFRAGMSPGPDVAELNRNLRALGYASELNGDAFTDARPRGSTPSSATGGFRSPGNSHSDRRCSPPAPYA